MKNRLFILGDSWVFWPMPDNHWSLYLEKYYEVFKYGAKGINNTSIVEEIGNLPDYQDGDRLIIVYTDPTRPLHTMAFFNNDKPYTDILDKYRIQKVDLWEKRQTFYKNYKGKGMNVKVDTEIAFYRKLKYLLAPYKPVFVTWSKLFYSRCSDFTTLIEVSSLQEENKDHAHPFEPKNKYDGHPGPKGCFEFYKRIHSLLEIPSDYSSFNDYKSTSI